MKARKRYWMDNTAMLIHNR